MRYVYLLFLPAFFLLSCGDDPAVNGNDSTKVVERDFFREGVDKLKRNGFLKNYSGAKLDSLVAVHRADTLNGMKNLLSASGDLLFLDLDQNDRAPHDIYKQLVDTIGKTYTDLQVSEIRHKYLPEEPGDKDTGWFQLDQKFGNTWYSRKLYYMDGWPIDNYMYRVYNTMLADQNEDTRLFLAEYFVDVTDSVNYDDFLGNLDVNRMGLMRLTRQQADTLLSIPELSLEAQPEFEVYTTAKVEEQLQKFWKTGLFSNEKWFDTLAADVRMNSIYKQQDIIDFYGDYFSTVMFDTLNPYNPYEEMITSLSSKSRGFFKPIGTGDELIGQTKMHAVRFNLNGTVYEKDFTAQNGIESPYFLDFVNEALAEQKAGGSFYSVSSINQTAIVIFIEDDQVDAVMRAEFFSFIEKGAPTEMKIMYGDPPKAF